MPAWLPFTNGCRCSLKRDLLIGKLPHRIVGHADRMGVQHQKALHQQAPRCSATGPSASTGRKERPPSEHGDDQQGDEELAADAGSPLRSSPGAGAGQLTGDGSTGMPCSRSGRAAWPVPMAMHCQLSAAAKPAKAEPLLPAAEAVGIDG